MWIFTGCRQNYYKSKISNEDGCKLCPSGSINSTENTGCECTKGRYRLKNESRVNKASCYGIRKTVIHFFFRRHTWRDNHTVSSWRNKIVSIYLSLSFRCFSVRILRWQHAIVEIISEQKQQKLDFLYFVGFPSKVRDIRIEKGNSGGAIILRWKSPEDDGGLPGSLKYDVDCVPDSNRLKYTPRRMNLTKTSVQISGLIRGYQYNFTVFSKNTISELYANGSYAFRWKIYKVPSGKNAVLDIHCL